MSDEIKIKSLKSNHIGLLHKKKVKKEIIPERIRYLQTLKFNINKKDDKLYYLHGDNIWKPFNNMDVKTIDDYKCQLYEGFMDRNIMDNTHWNEISNIAEYLTRQKENKIYENEMKAYELKKEKRYNKIRFSQSKDDLYSSESDSE